MTGRRGRLAVVGVWLMAGAALPMHVNADRLGLVAPAVYKDALASVQRCIEPADSACVTRGFSSFMDRLATQIEALPSGRAGLGAWLRFAATMHDGAVPPEPPVEHMRVGDALLDVYATVGFRLDGTTRARIDRQLASLSPSELQTTGELLSAFATSLRLATLARRGSGIERWMHDPMRAATLAKKALRAPAQAPREARELLDAIARVNLTAITQAAILVAEALERFDVRALKHTLDLPLVFIGGHGDTVHAADRLLLIDVSGDDTYLNNAGGGLVETPVPDFYALGGAFAADLGAGDDVYRHRMSAQGSSFGGFGILYDEGGSDSYDVAVQGGHGDGFAGVGVLYDTGTADDAYLTIWQEGLPPPSQTKGAALAGIGLLVDEGGSDTFRQDGVDGIGYGAGGGLGLLANLGAGDDVTISGEAPFGDPLTGEPVGSRTGVMQGYAELDAVGILYDEAGDDSYSCIGRVRQGCQGAAGGTSLGLLWDRGGDDGYASGVPESCDMLNDATCFPGPELDVPIEAPSAGPLGQGASYLWVPPSGIALGVLYDESGSDRYIAPRWAQGYGSLGNLGLLHDAGGGEDDYMTRPPSIGSRADGETWLDGLLGIGIDE